MRTRDIACGLRHRPGLPARGARRRHRLGRPAGRSRPGPPGDGQVFRAGRRLRRSPPRRSLRDQLPGHDGGRHGALGERSGLAVRLSRCAAAGHEVHREASSRMEAQRRRQRPGRRGAAHRPERVRLFHRRPGDRLDAAGRRRRDRGGPALPDPPQRRGGRGDRPRQRPLRGRRHRRAAAAGTHRRRAAGTAAEGTPHPPGRLAADADRALRAAASQQRGLAPGLGQGHRGCRQSAGGDDDRAALSPARARALHGGVQLRAREGGRALSADPADDGALLRAGAAHAGGAGAALSLRAAKRWRRCSTRTTRRAS